MARAYRPRRATANPVEVLRLLVDEHLADAPGRPGQRPAWDALGSADQRAVVTAALAPDAVEDEQAWLVGNRCRRPLVAAVAWTLRAHTVEDLR